MTCQIKNTVYEHLTGAERLRAMVAARARGDGAEATRLLRAAPRSAMFVPDVPTRYGPLWVGFEGWAFTAQWFRMKADLWVACFAAAHQGRCEAWPLVIQVATKLLSLRKGFELGCARIGLEPAAVLSAAGARGTWAEIEADALLLSGLAHDDPEEVEQIARGIVMSFGTLLVGA